MSRVSVILVEGTILQTFKTSELVLPAILDHLVEHTQIDLVNEDGELLGRAFVDDVEVLPFHHLTDEDLTESAHPAMRTRNDAFATLHENDPSFTQGQPVTLLRFYVDTIRAGAVYVDSPGYAGLDLETYDEVAA